MAPFRTNRSVPADAARNRRRASWRALYASAAATLVIVAPAGAQPEAHIPVGRAGPSFAGSGKAPTAQDPESKLWWNDRSWWASMWGDGGGFRIFRYDRGREEWLDTGTALDPRRETFADTLWDGRRLYVASHKRGAPAPGRESRLYRYRYDGAAGRYLLDAGFPVTITRAAPSSLVIAKDSTGTVWATWVQASHVYVNRTVGDDRRWGTPFPLGVKGARVRPEDVAAVVAFKGRVGVLWSNQRADAFFFAVRRDGAPAHRWQAAPKLPTGPGGADNHLNVKADARGRVFAVVKTSATALDEPLIVLLARNADGVWSGALVGTVAENQTRPILMIDRAHDAVHVLAAGPSPPPASPGSTAIFRESAATSDLAFATGPGTVVLHDRGTTELANVTGSKQAITAASGFILLAANRRTDRYWYRPVATSSLPPAAAPFASAPSNQAARVPPAEDDDSPTGRAALLAAATAVLLVVVVALVVVRRALVRR